VNAKTKSFTKKKVKALLNKKKTTNKIGKNLI